MLTSSPFATRWICPCNSGYQYKQDEGETAGQGRHSVSQVGPRWGRHWSLQYLETRGKLQGGSGERMSICIFRKTDATHREVNRSLRVSSTFPSSCCSWYSEQHAELVTLLPCLVSATRSDLSNCGRRPTSTCHLATQTASKGAILLEPFSTKRDVTWRDEVVAPDNEVQVKKLSVTWGWQCKEEIKTHYLHDEEYFSL